MSTTAETTSTRTFHPGSERGYDNSLMVRLIQQYKEDSNDEDMLTWQRTSTLSSKRTLFDSNIVDEELNNPILYTQTFTRK